MTHEQVKQICIEERDRLISLCGYEDPYDINCGDCETFADQEE